MQGAEQVAVVAAETPEKQQRRASSVELGDESSGGCSSCSSGVVFVTVSIPCHATVSQAMDVPDTKQ